MMKALVRISGWIISIIFVASFLDELVMRFTAEPSLDKVLSIFIWLSFLITGWNARNYGKQNFRATCISKVWAYMSIVFIPICIIKVIPAVLLLSLAIKPILSITYYSIPLIMIAICCVAIISSKNKSFADN